MKVIHYSYRPYENEPLVEANQSKHTFSYHQEALNVSTADLAGGFDAVSVFTNDDLSEGVLKKLAHLKVKYVVIRASGYDHADLQTAKQLGIHIANVPEYSPYSVAEHAVSMALCLNRKFINVQKRLDEYNFTLDGLQSMDIHGKTIGIIGLGRIGSITAKIMKGFGCTILAYDPIVNKDYMSLLNIKYAELKEVLNTSDILFIHAPLSQNSKYMINKMTIEEMKTGVLVINCGRGAVVHTRDLIQGISSGKIGAYGMDVYEKEKGIFFHDYSNKVIKDEDLLILMSMKNVLITPHQAFFTNEALSDIAQTTVYNLNCWEKNEVCKNELTV